MRFDSSAALPEVGTQAWPGIVLQSQTYFKKSSTPYLRITFNEPLKAAEPNLLATEI